MDLLPTRLQTRYQDLKPHPSHPPWSHLGLIPGLPVPNHPHSLEVSPKVPPVSLVFPIILTFADTNLVIVLNSPIDVLNFNVKISQGK